MSFLKRNGKITSKFVEHKLEEACSHSIPWDVQRWRFILLNFPFLNNFPDLLLFTSLVFPNDRWNLTALFVDNSQVI